MIGSGGGDGVYRPTSARGGGETQSRWLCWHLSCSEICLELCSTCIKTGETFLCQDKKKKNNNLRFNPLKSLYSSVDAHYNWALHDVGLFKTCCSVFLVCMHNLTSRLPLELLTDLMHSDIDPYTHTKSQTSFHELFVMSGLLFILSFPLIQPSFLCASQHSVRAHDVNVSRVLLFTIPKLSITFYRPDTNPQSHTGVSLILSRM